MTKFYVLRDGNGDIVNISESFNEGFDVVALDENHADIVAYINPPIVWDDIRADRDFRLSACDWTQIVDAPLTSSKVAEWATYRQSLRDVPSDFASPDLVIWPVEPI